jgi:pilus assembly protein CpaE
MRAKDTLSVFNGGLKALFQGEGGAASAEFGIFLPVILFGCLTMGDIGLALHQRMTLDHVVRSGGQIAMSDPGEAPVRSAIESAARKNFALAGGDSEPNQTPVTVDVARYCSCPDDRATAVSCSDSCEDNNPPFVFYRMSVAKNYDGIIVPELALGSELDVQIR